MHAYDTMFSADQALKEQIAAEVFGALSEAGPVLALMDRSGNCWSSDPEQFAAMGIGQERMEDLWAKVDDGAEPAVMQAGDTTVMVTQLATEHANCGYLILAISRGNAEWTPVNFDLAAALFEQVSLAAKLVEKTMLLEETQARRYSVYGTAEAPAN